MPDSESLAKPATQESEKEVVNNYDSKQGSYQEQAPSVSTGASPAPQDKCFTTRDG